MFRSLTRITLASIALLFAARLQATIIYVNLNATGANNGSSWVNAFTSLQSGIGATLPGDTIWVAQGVYKPTTTTTRTISFALPDAVKIFGGFNGTETSITQQNVSGNSTVLSGDIGITGNSADNSHHVITTASVSNATLLDGFRIVSGNANGASADKGGALLNTSGSPLIRNCTFQSNIAQTGGAIAQNLGGNMSILNCTISNNVGNGTSASYGGAVDMISGTVTFSGCLIRSNSGWSGAAFNLGGGILKIDRCEISGNTASSASGAIYGYQDDFTLTLTNSLIVGNSSTGGASAIYCVSSPQRAHSIINCTIADNSASPASLGCTILNATSQVYNTLLYGNSETPELVGSGISTGNLLIEGISLFTTPFVAPGSSSLAPFTSVGYDYHVTLFAPPINAGNATYIIPAYNLDLDNTARTQGPAPDIGCYEHVSCSFNLAITSTDSTAICPGSSTTLNGSAGSAFLWSNNSTASSISVNTAGTYTLMADSAGCLGNASYTVTLLSPAVNISGPAGLCPNTTGTLFATGTNLSSYAWSSGGTADSLLITTAGTYSVSVITTEGCTVTDTYTVTALPGVNPVVSFNTPVLSTGSFTTYQWLLNGVPLNGATSAQYTAMQDGDYSVVVTNASGCSDTSAIYTIIALGLNKTGNSGFYIYPNPAAGVVNLASAAAVSVLTITVLDMQGRMVYNETKENVRQAQPLAIELNALADGIYFLRLQTGAASHTEKLVIRR